MGIGRGWGGRGYLRHYSFGVKCSVTSKGRYGPLLVLPRSIHQSRVLVPSEDTSHRQYKFLRSQSDEPKFRMETINNHYTGTHEKIWASKEEMHYLFEDRVFKQPSNLIHYFYSRSLITVLSLIGISSQS